MKKICFNFLTNRVHAVDTFAMFSSTTKNRTSRKQGRKGRHLSFSPRAEELILRAARATASSRSAVVERLVLDHCERLIAEEEKALA
jgi:hypothetical protein